MYMDLSLSKGDLLRLFHCTLNANDLRNQEHIHIILVVSRGLRIDAIRKSKGQHGSVSHRHDFRSQNRGFCFEFQRLTNRNYLGVLRTTGCERRTMEPHLRSYGRSSLRQR